MCIRSTVNVTQTAPHLLVERCRSFHCNHEPSSVGSLETSLHLISLLPSLFPCLSPSPWDFLADRRGCEVWMVQLRLWCCHFPSTQRVQGHQALANEQTPVRGNVPSGKARGILSIPMPSAALSLLVGDGLLQSLMSPFQSIKNSEGESLSNK